MEADAAAGGEQGAGGGSGGGGDGGGGEKNAVALELLPFPQVNMVDFGSIHINERATRKVCCWKPCPFFRHSSPALSISLQLMNPRFRSEAYGLNMYI